MVTPYKRKTKASACWLAVVIFMSPFAMGDWAVITPEELAAAADVIVSGECIGAERVAFEDGKPLENIGVIRVETVFKGEEGRSIVLLLLPPSRPKGLVASGDIVVTTGQRGLWYLKKKRPGLYFLDRPDSFVGLADADAPIKGLKKP